MTNELKPVQAKKRTRKSAKAAGATFERKTADYFAEHLDDRIDRRVKTGAKDKGDIANVRLANGSKIVIECKNTSQLTVGPFLNEAEVERINDSALAGVVIAKRHGVSDMGRQIVLMTVDDLLALIKGERN